ncbi:MAG TPA: hypothetical protein VF173_37660 [Thermoanaerobaculia bacterium]|nr:hypothetical protein [Thermoanaerobaculia bacterium]
MGIIDCGVESASHNPLSKAILDIIDRNKETTIDFLMITHLDWDHISGLSDLILDNRILKRIERIYCNGAEFRTLWEVAKKTLRPGTGVATNVSSERKLTALGALAETLRLAALKRQDLHFELVAPSGSMPSVYPVKLEQKLLGEVSLSLFSPSQALRDRAFSVLSSLSEPNSDLSTFLGSMLESKVDWNAASAVVALDYKGRRVLFGGDANILTWKEISNRIASLSQIECDVVIAWHHGARLGFSSGRDYDSSIWEGVLGKNRDDHKYVLISHGCGRYGHPHIETVTSVVKNDGLIYCTQLHRKREVSLSELPGDCEKLGIMGSGWDGEDVDVIQTSNACSGNITVTIADDGLVSVNCAGPRGPGELQPGEFCCLYSGPLTA